MKKMSIKTSILIPTLAVLIVGVIVMVSIVSVLSSSTTNDLTGRLVSATVNEYSNEFKTLCMDSYGAVISLAPVIQKVAAQSDNPREEVVDILAAALMANQNMFGIWTCWEPNAFDGQDSKYANTTNHDATGRYVPYVFKDGSGYSIEATAGYDSEMFYRGARDSGKPYMTDPFEYDVAGKTSQLYTLAIPIKKDGVVAGVLGADILLDDAINIMNSGDILEDGYLFTISPSGDFATHRNSDLLLQEYSTTWMKDYSAQIDSILKNGGSFSVDTYSDQIGEDITFLGSGVMVGDTGRYWAVCGIVPQKTVNASSTTLTAWVIIIGLVLILVMGLTVLLIVRGRLRKLPVLTAAAEAMSLGDVQSSEFDLETGNTKNEISLLERAFSKMSSGVKDQDAVLDSVARGNYTVDIAVRSEQDVMNKSINMLLDNNNSVMSEIRSAASQVASGAGQIAQASQNLATSTSEQAATIEEFTATLTEIESMAKENAELSTMAKTQMQKVGAMVGECTEDMKNMLGAMHEISTSSQNISKVIKVIDDIAFQTNILALNAAVEAARAGQHGKGFAVVADEVRNLASKSAEAAKETSGLISESIQNVNEGNVIVEKVGESIRSVSELAGQSADSVGKIYAASLRQSESMEGVTAGVAQLSSVVQANAATAQQTAASSEEMSAQSATLDNIVSRFKLKSHTGTQAVSQFNVTRPSAMQHPRESNGFAISDKY